MNNTVIRYGVEKTFNQINDPKTGHINFDKLELTVSTQYITVKVISRMLCEGYLQEISEIITELKELRFSKMEDYSNATLYFRFRVYADEYEPALKEIYSYFNQFIEDYSYARNLDKLKARMSFLMDQINEPLQEGEDSSRKMLRDASHKNELRDLENLFTNIVF